MKTCNNCRFFARQSSDGSGTCYAWGYGKPCHTTYNRKSACGEWERGKSKRYGKNGILKYKEE